MHGDPMRDLVEDIDAALAVAGLSHKSACVAMEIDPARWSRMRSGELSLDARKLARLGEAFDRAFAERRARRCGLKVEASTEAAQTERLRRLMHALVDAVDVFPMVKAELEAAAVKKAS